MSPSAAEPTASSLVRVRSIHAQDHAWEVGTLVQLSADTLVMAHSIDSKVISYPLADLAVVELSNRTRTSALRALGGLVLGAGLGGVIGGTAGALAGRDSEIGSVVVLSGAGIGATIGGFLGLIVGQNPVRAWDRVRDTTDGDLVEPDEEGAWLEMPNSALHASGAAGGR